MHFVARNTADGGYGNAGYHHLHLKPDAIGFKHVQHKSPKAHRRNTSESGIQLLHVNLAKSKGSSVGDEKSEQEKSLLDNSEKNEENAQAIAELETVSETPHDCKIERCQRVIINIAGAKYETQFKTLERLPSTLLGNPEKRRKYWDPKRNEFFFDRYRPSFPSILYYYQSGGRLKRPVEVPVDIFLEELEFFELGDSVIDQFKISEGFLVEEETFDMPESTCNRKIWETFEYPESSILAKIVAILSVLFILTSVATFCLETLPQFHNNTCKEFVIVVNETFEEVHSQPNYRDPFFIIESCCIAWFVFELVMRAISCPCKITFAKSWLNWIDLTSVVPYFLFLVVFFITQTCSNTSKSAFLSVLRVLRVVRVLKLSKHSVGLKILGKTLQMSLSELTMFALFLGIGVISFAAAIYYAESQEDHLFFVSIPDAFWWAVVSMTTVGYGDVYPTGIAGKIIGSMCVLSGLLAIALPVPVIVTNFNNIYRQTTGRGLITG